jgi:cytidylate kinase
MNIITIDGPTASGKSTIARLLSLKLNYFYLSSGYLYRTFSYFLHDLKINIHNQKEVENLISTFFFDYRIDIEHNPYVIMNEKKLTEKELHTKEISSIASTISAYPHVRSIISESQRKIVLHKNSIIDGRDCGSNVFKDIATIKFYLTASTEARAQRLCQRNSANNYAESLNKCEKDLKDRDHKDINRFHSPLKPADDAIIVDSTNLEIEQTLNIMLDFIYKNIII